MRQLRDALYSPAAVVKLPARSWGWLALYLSLAAGVLGVFGWLILEHSGALRGAALSYLFPDSWHFAAGYVVDRFFDAQQIAILMNAVIAGSLLLVTILLFYVKERLSASFEEGANLTGRPMHELPLWLQAWEEIKLFLMFLAVQASIFWLDYYPGRWRVVVALIASYGFLFFMFAVDFLSPVMQRHDGHYSRILKTILRHPVAALVFGAIFAAPSIVAGYLWPLNIVAVFAANAIGIAWAAVAGTWLGARMLDDFEGTPRSGVPLRVVAWVALAALLGWNGYRFGALVRSVHHKSQVLKCDYSVDLGSFGVDMPSFVALLDDRVEVGLHFDVTIHNPTRYKVEIENNRLELIHAGENMGTSRLSPVTIEPGATVDHRVELTLEVTPSRLRKGLDLLDPDDWEITLYLEVAPRFEFSIYLLRPGGA